MNFTDEEIAMKLEVPEPSKYKAINLDNVKEKAKVWNFDKESKVQMSRIAKLPKLNEPSPASYRHEDAF